MPLEIKNMTTITENKKVDIDSYAFGGGAAFFLNQYISIDIGLAYAKASAENYDADGVVVNGGISVYF